MMKRLAREGVRGASAHLHRGLASAVQPSRTFDWNAHQVGARESTHNHSIHSLAMSHWNEPPVNMSTPKCTAAPALAKV